MRRLSLLRDTLFRARVEGGSLLRLTLPDLLARLSAGEDLVFPALRPHQRPAWHAFAVQLAALAMEAAELDAPPTESEAWRDLLCGLTSAFPHDEPWHLVVDDWTLPAFMQPPCLPGAQSDYRNATGSVQELDLLVTSKNHDEKIGKLRPAIPEEAEVWVYALVSLQGFAGFMGRGNFNTMRMNGGFGSRPQFRLVVRPGSGAEFLRDLRVLRVNAPLLDEQAYAAGIGTKERLSLLWLAPWGDQPLPLQCVHPLCLEVTRRIRLREAGGGLEMLAAGSQTMRVAAKETKGLVLDPWVPIVKDGEPKALTAQADAFNYHRLAPLLFDDKRYQLPLLALPTTEDMDAGGGATLLAQVLVGGSGKTDGCLRREIPIATVLLRKFATRRGELALRAQAFIELAGLAQGKVLRAALLQFVDGGGAVNWQNKDFGKAVGPWVTTLERRIDEVFFSELFATETDPPMSDAEARTRWVGTLRRLLSEVFTSAVEALPTRDRSRHMAQERARRLFENAARIHLERGSSVGPGNEAKPAAVIGASS